MTVGRNGGNFREAIKTQHPIDKSHSAADVTFPAGARVLPNENGTAPGLYPGARQQLTDSLASIFSCSRIRRASQPMFREIRPVDLALGITGLLEIESPAVIKFAMGTEETIIEAAIRRSFLPSRESNLASVSDRRGSGPAQYRRKRAASRSGRFDYSMQIGIDRSFLHQ